MQALLFCTPLENPETNGCGPFIMGAKRPLDITALTECLDANVKVLNNSASGLALGDGKSGALQCQRKLGATCGALPRAFSKLDCAVEQVCLTVCFDLAA